MTGHEAQLLGAGLAGALLLGSGTVGWLVKEYFGMTVGETIKSWSIMETILSVSGLLGVLALSAFV
ncbi:MAG: gluconate transporter family protein [Jatrophihabitantaceae bacterium]|nr:gluconate transporter family protein [Jatrophihabitantaceae bacterium]